MTGPWFRARPHSRRWRHSRLHSVVCGDGPTGPAPRPRPRPWRPCPNCFGRSTVRQATALRPQRAAPRRPPAAAGRPRRRATFAMPAAAAVIRWVRVFMLGVAVLLGAGPVSSDAALSVFGCYVDCRKNRRTRFAGDGARVSGEDVQSAWQVVPSDAARGESDGGRRRPRVRRVIWWAHQDSNLEPMDSLSPAFPPGAAYLIILARAFPGRGSASLGCGTLEPAIKDARAATRRSSPQVVSAPSGGVPLAWLRVAGASLGAQTGSLSLSRSSSAFRRKRTIFGAAGHVIAGCR